MALMISYGVKFSIVFLNFWARFIFGIGTNLVFLMHTAHSYITENGDSTQRAVIQNCSVEPSHSEKQQSCETISVREPKASFGAILKSDGSCSPDVEVGEDPAESNDKAEKKSSWVSKWLKNLVHSDKKDTSLKQYKEKLEIEFQEKLAESNQRIEDARNKVLQLETQAIGNLMKHVNRTEQRSSRPIAIQNKPWIPTPVELDID